MRLDLLAALSGVAIYSVSSIASQTATSLLNFITGLVTGIIMTYAGVIDGGVNSSRVRKPTRRK